MLQSLLEERFGLKVHRETQTKQGFALVVDKNGPKLKPAEASPVPAQDLTAEERAEMVNQQRQMLVKASMAATTKRMNESSQNGTTLRGCNAASWTSVTTEEIAARLVSLAEAP